MKKQQEQNLKPEKKSAAGIIGFILALVSFVTCGLTAVPGLIYSVIGFRRKGHRVLASIGLVISLIVICLLSLHILRTTEPGSVSYPINLVKYRLASKSHFWIDYDKTNIVGAKSHNNFLWSFGTIHFDANKPGCYKIDDVVDYAKKHEWIARGIIKLTKEDILLYLEDRKQLAEKDLKLLEVFYSLGSYSRSPFWIIDDVTVLGFDTGNVYGIPAYIMLSGDGSEMVVIASQPIRVPDPASPFKLPEAFENID
jgi:hypothetical protein